MVSQEVQHDEHPPVVEKLSLLDRLLPIWIGIAMAAGLLLGRLVPGLDTALNHAQLDGISLPIAIGLLVMMYPVLGQGSLRPPRYRHRGPQVAAVLAAAELGARPCDHVRVGVAAAARSAGLPHRADHRRLGALHRHGHHLERPRVWRPRGRSGAGRAQLAVPGRHVRRAWLVLPVRLARLARPGTDDHPHLAVAHRQIGDDFPRHPTAGRLPVPTTWRTDKGRRWYETTFLPKIGPWALYGLLFTIVILFALQGDQITHRPLDVARIAVPLLAYFAIMWTGGYLLGWALSSDTHAPPPWRSPLRATTSNSPSPSPSPPTAQHPDRRSPVSSDR